jgi:hypothetical protein
MNKSNKTFHVFNLIFFLHEGAVCLTHTKKRSATLTTQKLDYQITNVT